MDFVELLPIFMFLALAAFLFTGFPVAFVLGGIGFAFAILGVIFNDFVVITDLASIPSRIFGGLAENLILTAVPMFIFMGTMLERSGVANDLLNCLQVMLKRVPGGLSLAVIIMGTIMAATTGIIGASVVMMTLLALPVMRQRGYSAQLATGSIASSGTLGILIPPSIMLVIMADLLARSVGNMFVAAILPGLLLSGLYTIYVVTRCSLNPSLAPLPKDDFGPQSAAKYAVMVFRSFVPPVILIVLVLGSILMGLATPTEAAGVGAFGALLLGFINLVVLPTLGVEEMRFTPTEVDLDDHAVGGGFKAELQHYIRIVGDAVARSAQTNAMIFGIFIGATIFSLVFRLLGGDEIIVDFVESTGFGSWGILILLMAVVFFLGFFFDWIEITLIVLPVFAPIIELLDFGDHVEKRDVVYWFAIMMAVNLQTSFLTPPFGYALFYMKGVAPADIKLQEIYKGIIPFVLLQVCGLAVVMRFPEVALWLPRLLLD